MSVRRIALASAAVFACRSSTQDSAPNPEDAVKAAQATIFRRGFGSEPAMPGEVFDGLVPGGPTVHVAALHEKLHGSFSTEYNWIPELPEMLAMFRDSRVVIKAEGRDGIVIQLGLWFNDERDAGCPRDLVPAVESAWKTAPHATFDKHEIWLNPARGLRAQISDVVGQCRLEFERYKPLDSWLGTVSRSDMIGKPIDELASLLGSRGHRSGNDLAWLDVGVGFGFGSVGFDARAESGKVVSIKAHWYSAESEFESMLAKLTASYGKPTEVSGRQGRRFEWNGAMPVRLEYEDAFVTLIVGRPVEFGK